MGANWYLAGKIIGKMTVVTLWKKKDEFCRTFENTKLNDENAKITARRYWQSFIKIAHTENI